MAEKKNDLVGMLEEYFVKLPSLPTNARETIVQITPWLALIFGVLGVLATVSAFGILTVFSPFAILGGGVSATGGAFISVLLGLVSSALLLAAFPGTKNRKMAGWKWLFWSEIVSIISSVISIQVPGVIFSLVGLYLLFQIKSHYK